MSKKFIICVEGSVQHTYSIKAEDEESAVDEAYEKFHSDVFPLDLDAEIVFVEEDKE